MKLFFAAPDSFLSLLPTALASQVSRLHFCMKLILAAPTSGLPLLPTALLAQVSWATELNANTRANINNGRASKMRFMAILFGRRPREKDNSIRLERGCKNVTPIIHSRCKFERIRDFGERCLLGFAHRHAACPQKSALLGILGNVLANAVTES
jgi:hypothetical protein